MSAPVTSQSLFEKAKMLIPGGVNSPVRSFKHVGMGPIYFERADGPHLYDVEGKEYVDFCLSFGPHLLGHSYPKVVKAIREQVEKATSFGACHPAEVEFAELLLKSYPFLDRVRLVNSGTEAVMTAIRIARGYTGRNKILKFEGCYHGHSDGLLVQAGSGVAELSQASSKGVPPELISDTLVAQLHQIETVETLFKKYHGQIAAIIVEPIPANHGLYVPQKALLEEICSIAKCDGSLVIFDEVISGFRVGQYGASGYFDLKPDLVTLGKIIGGGLPLAAVCGTRGTMETLAPLGNVYQAGTLSGNPLATAAGVAVLSEIYSHNPYSVLETQTQWFVRELQSMLSQWQPVHIKQIGSIFWISFEEHGSVFPPPVSPASHEKYTQFFKGSLARGVYFAPSPYEVAFTSVAHTRAVLENVLERLDGFWKD